MSVSTQKQIKTEEYTFDKVSTKDYLEKNISYMFANATMVAAPFMYYTNNLNANWTISTMAISLSVVAINALLKPSKKQKEKDDVIAGLVPNKEGSKYFINMGNVVKEHHTPLNGGAGADWKKEGNIVAPLLIDETTLRTHMTIAGTTGSGKTVYAKNIMRQLVRDIGTGFMFIEGKGDNKMFHEIYAEMKMAGRLNDFYFLNFLDKHNSNTINLLEEGDFDSIRDVIVDFIISGKEMDDWLEGAKALMIAFLKVIIILRDANLSFNVLKSNNIDTIEDIYKYKKKVSLIMLRDLLLTPKRMFEFLLAIDRVYVNSGKDLIQKLQTYKLNENEELEVYQFNEDSPKIHQSAINVLLQQTQEVGDWGKLGKIKDKDGNPVANDEVYDTLVDGMGDAAASLYKLEISKSKFEDLFNTFLDGYGEIFAVEDGDINMEELI